MTTITETAAEWQRRKDAVQEMRDARAIIAAHAAEIVPGATRVEVTTTVGHETYFIIDERIDAICGA